MYVLNSALTVHQVHILQSGENPNQSPVDTVTFRPVASQEHNTTLLPMNSGDGKACGAHVSSYCR